MATIFLGDARAEQDASRLRDSFFESPDYRTLIESESKSIVVGRRGVGKSALYLKLSEYYSDDDKIEVVKFAPDEHHVLSFRPVAKLFDQKFNLVRAATRLAFRYALSVELARVLSTRFKFSQAEGSEVLTRHLQAWKSPSDLLTKLRQVIEKAAAKSADAEARIGDLADFLKLSELENSLASVLVEMKRSAVFLIDRLDEGYEPDEAGIAIVDGFVQAAIDLKDKIPSARCVVFLRDNIYRSIERYDNDFSRNIEQAVLRLHWEERGLLNFIANRIRVAAGIKAEKSLRVWDAVTEGTLQGDAGFHQCLRLTLFRPRDLLLLLNDAFRIANPAGRHSIGQQDINDAAKSISEYRLRDLEKEYSAHFPGLEPLVRAFKNRTPTLGLVAASQLISSVMGQEHEPRTQQQFEMFEDEIEAVRALYSVGFLGIREDGSNNFVFCHDGRKPDKEFGSSMELMVHPCYWMALNISPRDGESNVGSEIYDEYDVKVTSETPEQRSRTIGRLESELRSIEPGLEGAQDFERWSLKVVKVLFSGGLRNIELHANKDALQRRDIVGTNHGATELWARVLKDYSARQVLFEVKNFADMERTEFRQILSYLNQDYGNIGFVITRGADTNLRKDKELAWVRELRNQHGKVVVILPAKFLVAQLYKVRNPAKHDAGEVALDTLLDMYVRTYFGESAPKKSRK